jgi:cysteinyl-tRNA synthetase
MVQTLFQKGLAYEANGSVYFSVSEFEKLVGGYGVLSGRDAADQQAGQGSRAWMDKKRNEAPMILPCGRRPERSILCAGIPWRGLSRMAH